MSKKIRYCTSCREIIQSYDCRTCGEHIDDKCEECHHELEHNVLSRGPANTGVNGGESGYHVSDQQYHGGFNE